MASLKVMNKSLPQHNRKQLPHLRLGILAIALLGHSWASANSLNRCESIFENPSAYTEKTASLEQIWLWREELRVLLKADVMSAKDFDQIASHVEKLNSVEKEALLRKVSEIYRDVNFAKYKDVKIKNFKRVLDLLVSRSINPYQIFLEAKNQGKNAYEAYEIYLDRSFQATGILTKYSVHDIKSLAQFVQSSLKDEAKTNLDAEHWNITIYGSVFNGRAIKNISDVDSIGEYKSQNRFIERLGEKYIFKKYELDHFSANSMDKFSQLNAAQINPVLLIVNRDKVEIRVYPEVTVEEIKAKKLNTGKSYLSFTL